MMEYEKKRKCTMRERKQAARIISARDGSEKQITQKALETVGAMSDTEVLTFLDNEYKTAAAGVEPLQVEEIRPGSAPDDIYNLCNDLVNNYINSNGWEPEKISPLQWAACCLAVGRFVRSRSLFRVEQTNNIMSNNINQLDIDGLTRAAGAWLELCYKYNKAPLICDFCEFVAISKQAFYNLRDGDGVTPGRVDLFKRITAIEADGLRRRVIDPKGSPIGPMFLLKADHGLIEATKVQHEYIKADAGAAVLPSWDGSGALIDEKPEK